MSRKKDVKALRASREFIAYAERNGCEVVHGKGSHIKAKNAKGFAVIPNHPGDLATGTRKAIIKAFVAMGIAILVLLAVLRMLV